MFLVRHASDFENPVRWFDAVRQELDSMLSTTNGWASQSTALPRVTEDDSSIVVALDVPGLTEKDVQVQYNEGVLTLSGERKVSVPEGFKPTRLERSSFSFSRSFTLSSRVDIDKSTAVVADGVLRLTLPKAAETKPRAITVTSAR